MKTKLYAALLALLPLAAIAQPTVTNREQYGNNSKVHYLYTSNVHAGAPGANQTWSFATLSGLNGNSSDTLTESVIVPNSSTGPYAGLVQVERYSDSSVKYFKRNANNNMGITFFADSTNPPTSINYSHPLTDQIFTMTYGATVSDAATSTISDAGMGGTGKSGVIHTVDAYGTLVLPNGTFNNVVRLKTVRYDTFEVSIATIYERDVSYRWYSSSYASSLLTTDTSVFMLTGFGPPNSDTSTSTQYLLDEHIATGVNETVASHIAFTAHLDNSLTLSGAFNASKYTICLFNMAGQKMYDNSFNGGVNRTVLPVSNLAPGPYTILLMETGKSETMATIKTVKY